VSILSKEAHSLRRPNGYFDFLNDHYSDVRQFAPQFLDTLSFASHEEDNTLLKAIEVLRALNTTKRRTLPDDVPVDFVPGTIGNGLSPQRGKPSDGPMSFARFRRYAISSARVTFICPIADAIPILRRF